MNNDLSLYICRGDVCTRVNLGNQNVRNNVRNRGRENYDDFVEPLRYTEETLEGIECNIDMTKTRYASPTTKNVFSTLDFPRVNSVLYARIVGEHGEPFLYTPVTKEMLNELNTINESTNVENGILYSKYFNSPYDKYYNDVDVFHSTCY